MIFQIINSDEETNKFIQNTFAWVTPTINIKNINYLGFLGVLISNLLKLNSVCLHKSLIDFFISEETEPKYLASIDDIIKKTKASTIYIINITNISNRGAIYQACEHFKVKYITLDLNDKESIKSIKEKYKSYLKE